MIAFTCPFCDKLFQVDEGLAGRRSRCKQCGTVTRILAPAAAAASVLPRLAAPKPEVSPRRATRKRDRKAIDRSAVTSLAIGFGLACFAFFVPLASFVLHVLITVIHELGHVATAWIMGSPAVPSFDLTYGGGISHLFARQPVLIFLIYGALAALAFRERHYRPVLCTVLAVIILYSAVVFSPLRDLLITTMGHGAELLFAGIFLYRALSGSQVLRSEECPLYAFLGLYVVLADAGFAYRLITSPEYREEYGEAKGGGHWMDFSRTADEHLHVRLEVVAALFLLACVLTPVAAFLVHQYRRRLK
jgi:hypothetical protein